MVAGWVVLGFVLSALLLALSIAHGSGLVSERGLRWLTVAWGVGGLGSGCFLAVSTWKVFRREEPPDPVVLDTNVFVGAGFNPDSASAGLVAAVREGRLRMPWTDATRDEVRRILRQIPPLSWDDVEPLFRDEDRVEGMPDEDGLGWIPDPADRKFAALARRTGAVAVSSDRDLLGRRERARGFEVMTPGECRRRVSPS